MNRGSNRGRGPKHQVEDLRIKLNRMRGNPEAGPSQENPGNFLKDPARDGSYHQDNFYYGRGRSDFRYNENQGNFRGRGRANLNFANANYSPRNRGRGNRHDHYNENHGKGGSFRGRGYNKVSNLSVGQSEWNKGAPINIKVEVQTENGSRSCNLNDAATFSIPPKRGNYGYRRSRGRSFHGRGRGRNPFGAIQKQKVGKESSNQNEDKKENDESVNNNEVESWEDTGESLFDPNADTNNERVADEEIESVEYTQDEFHEEFSHDPLESEEIIQSNDVKENFETGENQPINKNNHSDGINENDDKIEMLEKDLKKIVITKPNDLMVANSEKVANE